MQIANRASVTNLSSCTDALDYLNDASAELLVLDLDNPKCALANALAGRATLNIDQAAVASHRRSATIIHALSDARDRMPPQTVDAAHLYKKVSGTSNVSDVVVRDL